MRIARTFLKSHTFVRVTYNVYSHPREPYWFRARGIYAANGSFLVCIHTSSRLCFDPIPRVFEYRSPWLNPLLQDRTSNILSFIAMHAYEVVRRGSDFFVAYRLSHGMLRASHMAPTQTAPSRHVLRRASDVPSTWSWRGLGPLIMAYLSFGNGLGSQDLLAHFSAPSMVYVSLGAMCVKRPCSRDHDRPLTINVSSEIVLACNRMSLGFINTHFHILI
ncbi:hypothetical protein VNO77_08519 [Canavalia gladiata]|uniref:Uncharacterized protein n=1 Tax=Canavalia gladiata TaxID=3824 RepID=A0AAN9M8L3_CANGL